MTIFTNSQFGKRFFLCVISMYVVLLIGCTPPQSAPLSSPEQNTASEDSIGETVAEVDAERSETADSSLESPDDKISIAVTAEAYPAPAQPPAADSPDTYPPPATTVPYNPYPEPAAVPDSEADADVLFVKAVQDNDDSWTFHVTVAHPDMGWEDYADGWDVVTPQGNILDPDLNDPFTRLLTHPHETEQPFTRSQSGIIIPADVTQVVVRAHDILHGYGGQEILVDLNGSGENFEVEK